MSAETITVGELVRRLARRVIDTDRPPSSMVPHFLDALNGAVREFLNVTQSSCMHADGSFTTVAGTATYDLADDFAVLIGQSVRYVDSPQTTLSYCTVQRFESTTSRYSTQPGDATIYMLRRRNAVTGCQVMQLWPVPSSAKVIAYRYVAIPPNIANASEETLLDARLPSQYHDAFVDGAMARLAQFVTEPTSLQLAIRNWQVALESASATEQPIVGVPIQRDTYTAPWGAPDVPPTNYVIPPWS